jgi:TIR domain
VAEDDLNAPVLVAGQIAPASAKLKIFISYSRQDMVVADELVADLQAAGFDVKIDREHLPFGEKWQKVLAEWIV